MTSDETKAEPGYAISERVHETYDQHGQHSMALDAACRVAVAEELRAQADYYRNEATREHKRCQRLADHAPKWQYESAIASAQELSAFVKHLTARAAALDPEGATR